MNCPDCNASSSERHVRGCDIEPCPYCGGQLLSCYHANDSIPLDDRMIWTGEWPGTAECSEFGWFVTQGPQGRVPCNPSDPDAEPDLNRVHLQARWDRLNKQFVLPTDDSNVAEAIKDEDRPRLE